MAKRSSVSSYGMTYVGSKNHVIRWLFDNLPSGNRFVDLFGGGGSVSHYAVSCGRYDDVLYSDTNPYICNLLKNAIDGRYSEKIFTPYWVSREAFKRARFDVNADPYIKYCFSFSANGQTYLGSGESLQREHDCFDWIVNGEFSGWLYKYLTPEDLTQAPTGFEARRIYLRDALTKSMLFKEDYRCLSYSPQPLRVLRRIREFGEACKSLKIECRPYTDYIYQSGDIVYCDIPYRGVGGSSLYRQSDETFDYDSFYKWAASIPCYISEYEMPSPFICVAERVRTSSYTSKTRSKYTEKLFVSPMMKL